MGNSLQAEGAREQSEGEEAGGTSMRTEVGWGEWEGLAQGPSCQGLIGPWEELGSSSHSKGRSLEDLNQVASSMIWFLENDCHYCVANGLDTGEWEVRRPAVSFAQLRPDVTQIGGENRLPAKT